MRKIRPLFARIWPALAVVLFASFAYAQTELDRPRVYDVKHYTIRVNFDPGKKIVFGDTTVQLSPLKEPLSAVELDAVDLKFSSVRSADSGKELSYTAGNGKVTVRLARAYSATENIAIRFVYTITAPKKGVYFITAAKTGPGVPHPAQIWTQNEPEDARYWFPSFDFPSDKATSEQFITAPKGEIAIGNGELLDTKKNADGSSIYHYRMNVPHSTYLTSFVIGDFVRLSKTHRDVPLSFYAYKDRKNVAAIAFEHTADMMKAFESVTGVDYPFPKYDQVMVSGFSEFSGMENITATTLADSEILYAEYPFLRPVVEDLVSHELAHSWFGNLVTCRNWGELWLNEGFATFMEAVSREKLYGPDSYVRKLASDRDEFIADDAISKRRHALQNEFAIPDNTLFDATTYQKGGVVLHMLRQTVGDMAFWKAVNLYLNRHKFENVVSSDLMAAMEEASGQKLAWFFDQWVYSGGYPRLEISRQYSESDRQLKITVDQTQKEDGLTPGAFRFPLDIEVSTPAGNVTRTLNITKRSETFTIELPASPTGIAVDKTEKVMLKTVKVL